MPTEIAVGLLSLLGTCLGSLGGVLVSNKLVNYRIEQLEKKVQAHNNLVDRMYKTEENVLLLDEKVKVANRRIDDLESFHSPE